MGVSNWIAVAAVVVAVAAWLDGRRYTRAQLLARHSASLFAERGEIHWSPVEYDFTIGSGGHAIARNVRVWLRAGGSTVVAAWTDEAGDHEEVLLSDLPSGPS